MPPMRLGSRSGPNTSEPVVVDIKRGEPKLPLLEAIATARCAASFFTSTVFEAPLSSDCDLVK